MSSDDPYGVRNMTNEELEIAELGESTNIRNTVKMGAARAELKRRDREYEKGKFDKLLLVARWSAVASGGAAVAAIALAVMAALK